MELAITGLASNAGLPPTATESTTTSKEVCTRKASKRFTSAQIAALTGNGKKRDLPDPSVPGLILRIGPTGTKYWLFRYKWKGNATRIAHGEFQKVGLMMFKPRINLAPFPAPFDRIEC
ncbi:MAG: DUF4102 domain-containing protein [Proteobacteria bacterium]|nr:DUF4102 domain-containing protein [Pseudomonadota bacterium]